MRRASKAADTHGTCAVTSVATVRRLAWFGIGLLAALAWSANAHAAVPPTEPVPTETVAPPPSSTPSELPPALGPLVVVPSGCAVPTPARAVFRGTIVLVDDPGRPTTFRFRVDSLLAGSLEGFVVGELVDVRFGEEARFLIVDGEYEGRHYILGVAPDPNTGLLTSRVREAAPLFGGDAVIGVNDSDINCPRIEDPIRTLMPDGSAVDTGVLTPLQGEGRSLIMAVLTPLAVAVGVLLALVLFKHLLFAVGRSLRDIGAEHSSSRPVARRRRHREPAALSGVGDQPSA